MKLSNDSHLHMTLDDDLKMSAEGFALYKKGSCIDNITFLAINSAFTVLKHCYNTNSKCLYLKEYFDEKGYAGLSFDYAKEVSANGFLDQLKMGYDAGFDCLKMLEAKPKMQRDLGLRVDDEIYDKAYDYAEKNDIPIILHVADPDWMWGAELKGFNPPSYYKMQAVNVLKKHPNLRLNLAHFGFMSDSPDLVVELLEKYPNLTFDNVPATDEFVVISKNPKVWREIFIEYNKRYMFGSDRGNHTTKGITEQEFYKIYPTTSAQDSRKFFEIDGLYDGRSAWPNDTELFYLHGLNMPEEAVENIFYNNFFSFFKKRKTVDYDIMAKYVKHEFSLPKNSKYHDADYQTLKEFLAQKSVNI